MNSPLHNHKFVKQIFGTVLLCLIGLSFFIDESYRLRAIGLIFTFVLGIYSYLSIRAAIVQKKWNKVEGSIISTKVVEEDKSFYPEVLYAYKFDNKKYESKRLSDLGIVNFRDNLKSANKIIGNYPIGKSITVYVNPKNHKESVLIPGVHWKFSMMNIAFFTAVIFLTHYPELFTKYILFGWLSD